MAMFKNTAAKVLVFAVDLTTGLPFPGDAGNITAKITLDGANTGAITDTNPTEISAANLPGFYVFDVTAGETNGDLFGLIAQSSTDNIQLDPVMVFTVDALTTQQSADVEDAVWDAVLTGSAHNTAFTAGKRLRQLADVIIHDGTCQAGSTSNSIVLDTGASDTDGTYDPACVVIIDGTGAGQSRNILEYMGSSRTAYVNRDWKVTPTDDSDFIVIADAGDSHVNEGRAQAGATGTITLNTLASAVNNAYNNQVVFLVAGTGADQARRITSYDGGSKVATVEGNWTTTPDTTSIYVMLPLLSLTKAEVNAEADTAIETYNLDHLLAVALADDGDIVDNSALAQMFSTDGDFSNYSANTDSQQSIRDAITASSPAEFVPTTGSQKDFGSENNTFEACATDDETKWEITGDGINPLQCTCQFEIGERNPIEVRMNGYFNRSGGGGGTVVQAWAFNYVTEAYDLLGSGSATQELRDRASDTDYAWSLSHAHHDHTVANHGEIKIRFICTAINSGGILFLDKVGVDALPEGSLDATAIWNFQLLDVLDQGTAGHRLWHVFPLQTTVATGDTTTSFTLSDGPTVNDALNNMVIMIENETTGYHEARQITDWTSGRVVTVDTVFSWTPTAGDKVNIPVAYAGGPTTAEMDAGHAEITTEVNANETKIDALNDVSAAEVNAQCDTALSDYDGPTTAEMDAGHAEITAKTNLLAPGRIVMVSPVLENGDIELVAGDDYSVAEGTPIVITIVSYSGMSLTDATAELRIATRANYEAGSSANELIVTDLTPEMPSADAIFTFEMTAAQTEDLATSPPDEQLNHVYQLVLIAAGGEESTLIISSLTVKGEIT